MEQTSVVGKYGPQVHPAAIEFIGHLKRWRKRAAKKMVIDGTWVPVQQDYGVALELLRKWGWEDTLDGAVGFAILHTLEEEKHPRLVEASRDWAAYGALGDHMLNIFAARLACSWTESELDYPIARPSWAHIFACRFPSPHAPYVGELGPDVNETEAPPIDENVLSERGIRFRGQDYKIRNRKGLKYICELVRHPNTQISSMTLQGLDSGLILKEAALERSPDQQALTSYKKRIEEVCEELVVAQADNNTAMAEGLQRERDMLVDELAKSSRMESPQVKKSRDAVVKAIKATVRELGKMDRQLGEYFDCQLQTSTDCSYTPGDIAWHVA